LSATQLAAFVLDQVTLKPASSVKFNDRPNHSPLIHNWWSHNHNAYGITRSCTGRILAGHGVIIVTPAGICSPPAATHTGIAGQPGRSRDWVALADVQLALYEIGPVLVIVDVGAIHLHIYRGCSIYGGAFVSETEAPTALIQVTV